MAMNGSDILVAIDGDVVGSQRDVSWEETAEEIDISSKDSRAGRYLSGRYGSTMSLEALYVPTDTAFLALQSALRNGTTVEVWRSELGAYEESADAIVTALSMNGPDMAESTASISLRIDGEWASGT